ncbi:MAG TPA: NAD(P)/FAD-dependent oxidoreductase [Myxococcales bacterium]|nr:NAD(P)/FAD-dependent oxidoreductase [Myxococcales bacterium]
MADVTVIGAGPVGSLLALTLARRGISTDVYERRPDMRRAEISAGRSINLAVSTRGLHALHEVGLDEDVLREAVPMLGRMTHALDGATALLPYGRSDAEYINSMSRGGLNRLLMTRAEETGRVRIHFGKRLIAYEGGAARFDDGTSTEAPVIVGADGSASALRSFVTGEVSQELLTSGYKELTMPPRAGGGFAMHREALHIWPRGSFMLIALPNLDGSFTCTLFLAFDGSPSFDQLRTQRDAQQFCEKYFPDALPLMPDMAAQLMSAPLGHMVTVKARSWSRGGALLIGDAAHAIVPFFGQGMNAGFEDVTLLAPLLESDDWPRAFARFAKHRKPDTDAIADLAVENFIEMRDKVADPEFLKMREIERQLQEKDPAYLTRYQMVTFTRMPYRDALRRGREQQERLERIARGELTP